MSSLWMAPKNQDPRDQEKKKKERNSFRSPTGWKTGWTLHLRLREAENIRTTRNTNRWFLIVVLDGDRDPMR